MIRRLAANGKTILISSHILTELAEMCDVVGIIEQDDARGRYGGRYSAGPYGKHTTWVRVRVLGGGGTAKWLADATTCTSFSTMANWSALLMKARTGEADLLREMVLAGFAVARSVRRPNRSRRSLCKSPRSCDEHPRSTALDTYGNDASGNS